MKPLLKLTRYPYEEPYHIELHVEASNGRQQASIKYYTNADDLPKLGDALIQFPCTDSREHVYEIGTEDPAARFTYHLYFRFFLISPSGDAGIEIRFNNNEEEAPEREIAEFTIPCEIAGINRLGNLLKDFGRLQHRVLEWDGSEGHLA
jgi:hypothetical protein